MTNSGELDIPSFLVREGAIGMLVQIDKEDGMLFGELEDVVHVSQTTLSKLLDDGMDLDLFKRAFNTADHGNAKRYKLTQRGMRLRREIESIGLDEQYKEFRTSLQALNKGKSEIVDWTQNSEITGYDWPGPERGFDPEPPDR